jgi:hypothetical protein
MNFKRKQMKEGKKKSINAKFDDFQPLPSPPQGGDAKNNQTSL